MGTVDVTLGYGFRVDADYDFKNHPAYNEEEHPDLWNFLDDQITRQNNRLDCNVETFGWDIKGDGAVFIQSSMVRWYGVERKKIIPELKELSPLAKDQLQEAAKFLDVPYQTGYIVVTSFG